MNPGFALAAALLVAERAATWAAADSSKAEAEGRALAQQLLAQKPEEDSKFSGILKIRDGEGKRIELPIQCRIIVATANWQSVYETVPCTNAPGTVKLTVIHNDSGCTEYQLSKEMVTEHSSAECVSTPGALPFSSKARDHVKVGSECANLRGNQAMIPFAGSDFWVADLGLEFLHWPEQRLLKKEMRRGQSCNVLESLNPQSDGYARVVSWLDIDTGGIVHAEAYDAKNKLFKEFDPKEFKKVNGRWELREMEIRNAKTGSRTWLVFNYDKK